MKLLDNEGNEIKKVDLGIVKAGETKEYRYTLYNESPRRVIEIDVVCSHKEVKVIDFPTIMAPDNKTNIRLSWSPSISVKQGLKTLIKVASTELYE